MSQKGSGKAHYTESWLTTGRISQVPMSSALCAFVDLCEVSWSGWLIALSIAVIHCVGLLVFAVKTAKKSV